MAKPLRLWSRPALSRLNLLVLVGSAVICLLLQLSRLPGMILLDVTPNWCLIWVVTWSIKRSPLQGLVAGMALGLIQDGLTAPSPTHALGLAIAGYITSKLDVRRWVDEDFICAALIVFMMVPFVETIFAGQLALQGIWDPQQIWTHLQQVSLSSAIISSLWTPLVYVPLNRWWDRLHDLLHNR